MSLWAITHNEHVGGLCLSGSSGPGLDPAVGGVVGDQPGPGGAGLGVEVVAVVTGRGGYGVVAFGDQYEVAVLADQGDIVAFVGGVYSLQGESLRRMDAVI